MIHIKSIASYLPGRAIHSAEIEKEYNWKPGWIVRNSGVETRHKVGEGESVVSMASMALNKALEKASMKPANIDLLIFASASYDYPIPHNSCLIKEKLKLFDEDFPCFDVDSTCLSFLNALDIASVYIEIGKYKTIAIVNSEISSTAMDYRDKKTFSLFGDAAVATIVTKHDDFKNKAANSMFSNHAKGARYAHIPAGGYVSGINNRENDEDDYFFKMAGRKLIKLTFQHTDKFFGMVENSFGIKLRDYDWVIPHQASALGLRVFIRRFKLEDEKVHKNLHKYGNCISASIPLGLCDLISEGKCKKGDKILLIGTAAGLSIGAMELFV